MPFALTTKSTLLSPHVPTTPAEADSIKAATPPFTLPLIVDFSDGSRIAQETQALIVEFKNTATLRHAVQYLEKISVLRKRDCGKRACT